MTELIKILSSAGSILTFLSGIAAFFYARWQYSRDSQFNTVNDDVRIKILKQIRELHESPTSEAKELVVLKQAEIKACYERIGLTFHNKINRLIIGFYSDSGLSFKDIKGRYFLACRSIMFISPTEFHFNVRGAKYSKWFFGIFPFIAALLICVAVYLTMLQESTGFDDPVVKFFSCVYMLEWLIILYYSMEECKKMNLGLAFWKQLKPYLQDNGIQTSDTKSRRGQNIG